jgi:hypothetical protein
LRQQLLIVAQRLVRAAKLQACVAQSGDRLGEAFAVFDVVRIAFDEALREVAVFEGDGVGLLRTTLVTSPKVNQGVQVFRSSDSRLFAFGKSAA